MLKAHSRFVKTLFFLSDILIVSSCWIFVYLLWFHNQQPLVYGKMPSLEGHLIFLIPVIGVYTVIFNFFRLYGPKRTTALFNEIADIFKASLISIVILGFIFYLTKEHQYSGSAFLFFWIVTVSALSIFRIFLRTGLHILRSKGYNLRYVLIVGVGNLAQEIAKKICQRQELGLQVVGFLAKKLEDVGTTINTVKVIGTYKDIKTFITEKEIDQVIFALSQKEHRILMMLLGYIADTMVDISVVPDIRSNFFTLRHGVEDFEGFPVIRLRENPLYGWNRIIKQCFDFSVALVVLTVSFPLMVLIAIMIKVGSRGPVFYKQERVGYDGKIFEIIKFRSMKQEAEVETGAVWAKKDDPRSTSLGKFLRKTSIDEIPQFINVLKGEMSLIGPRPERPVFIEKFRKRIPSYMLRHKMKAGMTGWAQIHGLRGNTSLEKRIEYDIYYIEHWSVFLDIKIIFLTIPLLFMEPQYSICFKETDCDT